MKYVCEYQLQIKNAVSEHVNYKTLNCNVLRGLYMYVYMLSARYDIITNTLPLLCNDDSSTVV